jgi:hypothetical protein
MRIYSERLGKFLSLDPLTKDYPWYTPYQFAGNKPIWASDLDGGEEVIRSISLDEHGNIMTHSQLASMNEIGDWIKIQKCFAMGYSKDKTSGYEWIGGHSIITGCGDPAGVDWHGPAHGTLTIDGTGSITKLSYDPTNLGIETKPIPWSKSIEMGWVGFKAFFITGNKNIEGSQACVETVHNYFSFVFSTVSAGLIGTKKIAFAYSVAKEFGKKFFAADGNIQKVDFFDVFTGAIADRLGFTTGGKIGVDILNSLVDIKIDGGIKVVGVDKNGKNVAIDLTFSMFKQLISKAAKDTGTDKLSEEAIKAAWDQGKNLLKYMLDNTK